MNLINLSKHRLPTLIGVSALVMWSLGPFIVSELDGIPLFQSLAIMFGSAFIMGAVKITVQKKWKLIFRQRPILFLIGVVGICGADFAYVFGAHNAHITHVDLISYLWPCFMMIFTSFLPEEKFSANAILGAILGILGIIVLLSNKSGSLHFFQENFLGYFLALIAALLWGGYSAFSRYYSDAPTDMISIYCGIGALICLGFHMNMEQTVVPSLEQIWKVLFLGVIGIGLTYQFWDYGVKYGNVKFLSMITYCTRLFGMLLLIIVEKEPFTFTLVSAIFLALVGAAVMGIEGNILRSMFNGNTLKIFRARSLKLVQKHLPLYQYNRL